MTSSGVINASDWGYARRLWEVNVDLRKGNWWKNDWWIKGLHLRRTTDPPKEVNRGGTEVTETSQKVPEEVVLENSGELKRLHLWWIKNQLIYRFSSISLSIGETMPWWYWSWRSILVFPSNARGRTHSDPLFFFLLMLAPKTLWVTRWPRGYVCSYVKDFRIKRGCSIHKYKILLISLGSSSFPKPCLMERCMQ